MREITLQEDLKRNFGGELFVHVDKKNNPVEDRMKKNFQRKHLKAYLRGDKQFTFGKDAKGHDMWFVVKEKYV